MSRKCGTKNHFKHGYSHKEKLYDIWKSMRQRCRDTNRNRADSYVNKGISVCEEWSDYRVFREWAIGAGYNDTLSIDRIDNDENYCPENCRWVDYFVQANNRSNNLRIEFNGEIKTLREWANTVEIPYDTIKRRIYSGWSIEKALTTQVRRHKPYETKRLPKRSL